MGYMKSLQMKINEIENFAKNTHGKITTKNLSFMAIQYPSEYDRNMRLEQLYKTISNVSVSAVGKNKIFVILPRVKV